MENKINIAELLKDCHSGMELDCTIVDDNGKYIWTLVDSNIIIEDKQVVNWTNFGI